jgi:hypothetical protein
MNTGDRQQQQQQQQQQPQHQPVQQPQMQSAPMINNANRPPSGGMPSSAAGLAAANDYALKQAQNQMKPKKKRDPHAPKAASNAYMIFCKEMRPILKKENTELSFGKIGARLGEMWRNLSAEGKKPYEDRAAADRERYRKEMENYQNAGGVVDDDEPSAKKHKTEDYGSDGDERYEESFGDSSNFYGQPDPSHAQQMVDHHHQQLLQQQLGQAVKSSPLHGNAALGAVGNGQASPSGHQGGPAAIAQTHQLPAVRTGSPTHLAQAPSAVPSSPPKLSAVVQTPAVSLNQHPAVGDAYPEDDGEDDDPEGDSAGEEDLE